MQVLGRSAVDKEDLRHLPDLQLAQLGITVLDRQDVRLRCNACGLAWRPEVDFSGHLPFDYWVCPARCNQH